VLWGAGCNRARQWAGGADDHLITICSDGPSEHHVIGAGGAEDHMIPQCAALLSVMLWVQGDDRAGQWVEGADDHMIPQCAALLSVMLWVQGVIEPGSGQEVLMTIWINGGIKGTAQLAAAKPVCLQPLLS